MWGFRCVLLALGFIHNTCGLLHGNLGLHAIFVSPSGDWKLGSMELAVNLTLADDTEHFLKHQHLLGKPYSSPERSQLPLSSNAGGDAATALNTLKAKVSNSFQFIAHSWAIYKYLLTSVFCMCTYVWSSFPHITSISTHSASACSRLSPCWTSRYRRTCPSI